MLFRKRHLEELKRKNCDSICTLWIRIKFAIEFLQMNIIKIISIILLGVDAYIGIRFLLNVAGVLQTSKYSPGATALYAVIFLVMSALGFYFLFSRTNDRWLFLLSIGPWLLILTIMLFSMIFGDYH